MEPDFSFISMNIKSLSAYAELIFDIERKIIIFEK